MIFMNIKVEDIYFLGEKKNVFILVILLTCTQKNCGYFCDFNSFENQVLLISLDLPNYGKL